LLAVAVSASAEKAANDDTAQEDGTDAISLAQATERLSACQPLPKPHYAHTRVNQLFDHEPLLRQWARVTSTITLSAGYPSRQRHKMAAAVAKQTGAKIAYAASPFTGRFAWPEDKPPTYDGEEWEKELHRFAWGLRRGRHWLGKDVEIAAVIISSEAFRGPAGLGVQPGNDKWNDALVEKWNSVYDTIRKVLGDKPTIVYYNAGGMEWYHQGWHQRPNHDPRETLDVYSASLYEITRPLQQIEEARRSIKAAKAAEGVEGFVPYLGVGKSYELGIRAKNWGQWGRTDYRESYDWWMGRFVHHPRYSRANEAGFADWDYVPFVVLYPKPELTSATYLGHFEAYVAGAHQ
jgi:hypothetical protein